MKRILVTGSSGFIGFSLTKSLLEDGYKVFGIDNHSDYYDTKLKFARKDQLNEYKNFEFSLFDIKEYTNLFNCLKSFEPELIIHLAAQPGVRYSISNPREYINSNVIGFFNVLEACKELKITKVIYASSSSVYGSNNQIPFSIHDKVDKPKNLYAATKKTNELFANAYSELFGISLVGLRFFTVYGPFGRPDMAIFSFTKIF